MDTLRVGVIGAGGIAEAHGTAWRSNAPRGEIVAIADITLTRAQHLAARHTDGRARVYSSMDDLLADPNVDAVDICLPHHLHSSAIIASAKAGKAILCEKPLCTSLEDAALIGAALRETGVTFMSAHNNLFQPSLIEARRLLSTGVLGRPFLIRSIEAFQHRGSVSRLPAHLQEGENPWAWRADPGRMGGGEVLDTGWHSTYRLLALADGDRPVAVSAMTDRFFVQAMHAEDTGVLLVRFASGAIGEIITSWAFGTIDDWQFEVAAELGAMAGNDRRLVHQLYGWSGKAERTNDPVHTFAKEVTHFLDVVQYGEPSLASFEHAARVLQLTKAAYRAVEEQRVIALPENPTDPGVPATEETTLASPTAA